MHKQLIVVALFTCIVLIGMDALSQGGPEGTNQTTNTQIERSTLRFVTVAGTNVTPPKAAIVAPGSTTKETSFDVKLRLMSAYGNQVRLFVGEDEVARGTAPSVQPARDDARARDVVFSAIDLAEYKDIGPFQLRAVFQPVKDSLPLPPVEARLDLSIDTRGPELLDLETSGESPFLILDARFEHADLPKKVDPAHFAVHGPDQTGAYTVPQKLGEITVSPDGQSISIPIFVLPGSYKLTINNALADQLGNPISTTSGTVPVTFVASPGPEPAKHVEFPPFTPPAPPKMAQEVFNPGDFVVTRVARLYYFRDAHRVAQIINRNVRAHNRAAVEQAQRRAEESRIRANNFTDERRHLERIAVRAAQDTRRIEKQISEAQADLRAMGALEQRESVKAEEKRQLDIEKTSRETEFKPIEDELARVNLKLRENDVKLASTQVRGERFAPPTIRENGVPGDASTGEARADAAALLREQETLRQQRSELERQLEPLRQIRERSNRVDQEVVVLGKQKTQLGGSSRALRDRMANLRASLDTQRENELRRQESALQAEAREDRAREEQFRKEVAAAHEDPDTFVPGDIMSVDPVTQVSISVIGEGVIQLRGPIKGINKIRTMINQIDSPLGQVKVGIHSIQVNGEKAGRMEKTMQRIEGSIDTSRFLVSQSTKYLRKAVQIVAAQIAQEAEMGGHYQVDRDRKYLYMFFGRDFVDELYAMNSEFLSTENKILSLHSMDTVSLNRAMFIMALARNDVRQRILEEFMRMIQIELPEAEYDFRRANGTLPGIHDGTHFRAIVGLPEPRVEKIDRKQLCKAAEIISQNAAEKYTFRSLRGFFDVPIVDPDIMTPVQREFIRLSQIFKSQMLAEIELKQRVVERAIIEDPSNVEERQIQALKPAQDRAFKLYERALLDVVNSSGDVDKTIREIEESLQLATSFSEANARIQVFGNWAADFRATKESLIERGGGTVDGLTVRRKDRTEGPPILVADGLKNKYESSFRQLQRAVGVFEKLTDQDAVADASEALADARNALELGHFDEYVSSVLDVTQDLNKAKTSAGLDGAIQNVRRIQRVIWQWVDLNRRDEQNPFARQLEFHQQIVQEAEGLPGGDELLVAVDNFLRQARETSDVQADLNRMKRLIGQTRAPVQHRKLLNQLIDEMEEKHIELVEGTRAHIASVDNYLKRLAIALEDDFKVQFYDPAFRDVRRAGREWDVTLGQIERTTILTNNRAFAKVSPQATFEFDLPERDIVIAEAMNGAKALATDLGALMKDPTFLAATDLLSGSSPATLPTGGIPVERSALSGLPTDTQENILSQGAGNRQKLGANLEALIPPPAIYKFETGTGFEIRPVIQPDGDSIIYDFNYLYTTNIREPVRADEKHLGRVKRHFVHTQVQTSSFELRELSRYLVQLKAARTAQGVPLLQDVPVVGVLFRPLPSAESALQQNLILGESTIYPTLFDLMGLRWAPHVVELDHLGLKDLEHVVRGRYRTISNYVFDEASGRVDEFLRLNEDKWRKRGFYRKDFYRRQVGQSPHHPGGYLHDEPVHDPTRNRFEMRDRRPPEMRQPPFDPLRNVPVRPELVDPDEVPAILPIETAPDYGSIPPVPKSNGFLEPTRPEQVFGNSSMKRVRRRPQPLDQDPYASGSSETGTVRRASYYQDERSTYRARRLPTTQQLPSRVLNASSTGHEPRRNASVRK